MSLLYFTQIQKYTKHIFLDIIRRKLERSAFTLQITPVVVH